MSESNLAEINMADKTDRPRPVVLLLIDGWGVAPVSEANAVMAAKIPNFFNLIKEYPVALLDAGKGNLNVRYLSIGSGDLIIEEHYQPITSLSETISRVNCRQLKIAETERFAALTHFFNSQKAEKFIGEDWRIISSDAGNRSVKPFIVLKRTIKEIISAIKAGGADKYDFIAAALPYLDLIAASGDFFGVKKAVQDIDKMLRPILDAVLEAGGVLVISAACGNVEKMRDINMDTMDLTMTNNPVPLIIAGDKYKGRTIGLADPLNSDLSLLAPAGTLADLAPTILKIMNIEKPQGMTGKSLI